MDVGVDDIVVAGKHAKNIHLALHLDHVDVGVARQIRPPTIWNPGASMSMSRNAPLVMQPRTPRPAWTAVWTSPQNAPKPGGSSRS